MENSKLENTYLFKKYSWSNFYHADCCQNAGIRSLWPAEACREHRDTVGAVKGWVRFADEKWVVVLTGSAVKEDLLKRVGLELGSEGFESAEGKKGEVIWAGGREKCGVF